MSVIKIKHWIDRFETAVRDDEYKGVLSPEDALEVKANFKKVKKEFIAKLTAVNEKLKRAKEVNDE